MSSDDILILAKDLGKKLHEGDLFGTEKVLESITDVSKKISNAHGRFPEHKDVKITVKDPLVSTIISLYRIIHIFNAQKKSLKIENFSKAWESIDYFVKFVLERLESDIPNSLLWTLMNELYFVFDSVRSFENSSEVANLSYDKVVDYLNKLFEDCQTSHAIQSPDLFPVFICNANKRPKFLLGLFARITLIRIYVATSDYRGALKLCEPINVNSFCLKHLRDLDTSAYTHLFYNIGFSYMMMRRYTDAAQMFENVINLQTKLHWYAEKIKAHSARLLSMISILSGQNFVSASSFSSWVKNIEEDEELLEQGNIEKYRLVFIYNSPKFIKPECCKERSKSFEADQEQQTAVFIRQVNQQLPHMRVRGFFKVYKSLTFAKVANLIGVDVNSALSSLIAAKMNNCQNIHSSENSNDLLQAEKLSISTGNVNFRIGHDSIISAEKPPNQIVSNLIKKIGEVYNIK